MSLACCGSSRRKKVAGSISWLGPTAILALVPKCPGCVAVYFAVYTGLTVSLPVAERVRLSVIWISISILAFLYVRFLVRLVQKDIAKRRAQDAGNLLSEKS